MKRIFSIFLGCSMSLMTWASDYTIGEGKWSLSLSEDTKLMDIKYDNQLLLTGVYASANYFTDESEIQLNSNEAQDVSMKKEAVSDELGKGQSYVFRYNMGGIYLNQSFSFYPDEDFLVTRLSIERSGESISTNCLMPLKTETSVQFLPSSGSNRMLYTPFDNDAWARYESMKLNQEMYSFSVTSIFDAISRQGLVCGAIDHDTWKSALYVKGEFSCQVEAFACRSGYTNLNSRDILPHGKVTGAEVSSSRFVLGFCNDWRDGMEYYAEMCTRIAPPLEWHGEGGNPVGWSSWGVMQNYISYEGVCEVADFLAKELMPQGFCDAEGKTVISLDAWWNDNLTVDQLLAFVKLCGENNQIPGIYYGPFCDFGKNGNNNVPGTGGKYTFKDIWLKVNGEPYTVDGSYCLDPTHPGTKMFMKYDINRFKKWGFKYIKADFLCDGIVEADSYYNTNVTTGVQAYNEGMAFLRAQIGDDMYLLESIAPIFPYQYAHARRTCCDSYGLIGETEYVMNSTSYGWWTDKLYHSNDPDHLVMKGIDNKGNESAGVNRARLTSGVVTGSCIMGDNFSDAVDRGFPEKSRERALELLTNKDVTDIIRTCGTFRPLDGYNISKENGADNFLVYETEQYLYVACFNYRALLANSGEFSFERLGTNYEDVLSIRELWMNTDVTFTETGFKYSIPASDARIFRITKKGSSGVSVNREQLTSSFRLKYQYGTLMVKHVEHMPFSGSIYSIQGIIVNKFVSQTDGYYTLPASLPYGNYLLEVKSGNEEEIFRIAKK